jgi:hypothetical protein
MFVLFYFRNNKMRQKFFILFSLFLLIGQIICVPVSSENDANTKNIINNYPENGNNNEGIESINYI